MGTWTARDDRLFVAAVGALIGLAWLALWAWGQSPHARYLGHHSLEAVRGGGVLLPVFVAGWTVMVVAMMLPSSLPLVTLFRALTRRRPDRRRLTGLLIAGYLAAWALFGLAIYLADLVVHEAVERSAWLETRAWAIGVATLALAGLYQFTPLKRRCLDRCRSPRGFLVEHWRGRRAAPQAFALGAHHGAFCVGCCWSLMLLMFAVGVGNLGWMLALGAAMATEKNAPRGRRLSKPLGAGLIGAGLVWLLSAI
jgi:predicted metal-binding membrane protein